MPAETSIIGRSTLIAYNSTCCCLTAVTSRMRQTLDRSLLAAGAANRPSGGACLFSPKFVVGARGSTNLGRHLMPPSFLTSQTLVFEPATAIDLCVELECLARIITVRDFAARLLFNRKQQGGFVNWLTCCGSRGAGKRGCPRAGCKLPNKVGLAINHHGTRCFFSRQRICCARAKG